jgi:hypothetical protein
MHHAKVVRMAIKGKDKGMVWGKDVGMVLRQEEDEGEGGGGKEWGAVGKGREEQQQIAGSDWKDTCGVGVSTQEQPRSKSADKSLYTCLLSRCLYPGLLPPPSLHFLPLLVADMKYLRRRGKDEMLDRFFSKRVNPLPRYLNICIFFFETLTQINILRLCPL